jgi:hypothetical protein
MNNKNKILLFIAAVGIVASPLLAFAADTISVPTPITSNLSGAQVTYHSDNDSGVCFFAFDGSGALMNVCTATHLNAASPITMGSVGLGSLANGTYTILWGGFDTPSNLTADCPTLAACHSVLTYAEQSVVINVSAGGGGGSVPSVGSSDIAYVGGPILGAFIGPSEYVLITFGPPLFVILLVFAVFFAIYHRVKVGRWL